MLTCIFKSIGFINTMASARYMGNCSIVVRRTCRRLFGGRSAFNRATSSTGGRCVGDVTLRVGDGSGMSNPSSQIGHNFIILARLPSVLYCNANQYVSTYITSARQTPTCSRQSVRHQLPLYDNGSNPFGMVPSFSYRHLHHTVPLLDRHPWDWKCDMYDLHCSLWAAARWHTI